MAELIYNTQATFQGPWLFDQAALETLETVCEDQWKQLESNKNRLIENAFKREKNLAVREGKYSNLTPEKQKDLDKKIRDEVENDPLYAEDARTVVLTLSSKKKVKDSTIKGAAEHVECLTDYVKKLEIVMVCGGVKMNITVPSADKKNDLQIVTFPEGSEPAKEAFVHLSIWARNYKPGFIRKVNGLPPFLLMPIILFWLFPLAIVVNALQPYTSLSASEEARELVK